MPIFDSLSSNGSIVSINFNTLRALSGATVVNAGGNIVDIGSSIIGNNLGGQALWL